jgi:serine/threonine-protein kinase
MELFKAANLKAMIRSEPTAVHTRLRRVMECCAQAFGYMHEKGWIHKDIKPDNVLVNKGSEVRVIDFSLASRATSMVSRMVTRKSGIVIQGTRTYIAPELVRREPLTTSADIYSLGILFYEALTGKPPFMGRNPNDLLMMHVRQKPERPSTMHPNIAPEVDAMVLKMLAKHPKERHESMHEVYAEIRNIKLFRQDPETFARERQEAEKTSRFHSVDQRLDSRADAARRAAGLTGDAGETTPDAAPKPAPKPVSKPTVKPAAASSPPPKPAAPPTPAASYAAMPGSSMMPAPMAPMMPTHMMGAGGMPYGMPAPYPGMPMPGMPMAGMPMPGYPMPGMQPPGGPQLPHGMPQAMPQGMPPIKSQGMPSAMPAPASPAFTAPPAAPSPPVSAPAAAKPAPSAPVPPAPPAKPVEEAEPEVPDGIDWISLS